MIDTITFESVLLDSVKEIFETMIFMDVARYNEPDRKLEGDTLLGTITFKDAVKGCLSICCDKRCAKNIAISMLGLELTAELSKDEICDAIGEVTNMVMGSVKTRMRDVIGEVQVSIPTVVSGRELENSMGEGSIKTTIKVDVQNEYIVELSLLYKESSK
jgi:chemotaxis protein CheX